MKNRTLEKPQDEEVSAEKVKAMGKLSKRKYISAAGAVTIVLGIGLLTGCGKKAASTTFPEDYVIANVKVGGMTVEEAEKALTEAAQAYALGVSFNGYQFDIPAADMDLKYNEEADLTAVLKAANGEETGTEPGETVFFIQDADLLKETVPKYYETALDEIINSDSLPGGERAEAADDAEKTEVSGRIEETEESSGTGENENQSENPEVQKAQEALALSQASNRARIEYDGDEKCYVAVDGETCEMLDYESAVKSIYAAAENLEPSVEVTAGRITQEGESAEGNARIAEACERANEYLDLELSVLFETKGAKATTVKFDKDTVAGWMAVQRDGETLAVDETALSNDMTELAKKHDKSNYSKVKFKTSIGTDIGVRVATSGLIVDANELFTKVQEALESKNSAQIKAVYNEVPVEGVGEYTDFGGNYCEIDLTNQHAYVYKNGKQVLSTAVVTGNVSKNFATPAGVYTIFTHDKDRYLKGEDYKTWVNYFCAFNGGIGFHDAPWRKSFGGDIYKYSGSHGCINMPPSAAKVLYDNVSIGTKVVVYGGVSSVPMLEQTWSGTTSYNVRTDSAPFSLDMTCLDNAPKTYSSGNPAVATVDAGTGLVTPVGNGSTVITVHADATETYKESDTTITVTVEQKPVEQPQNPVPQQPQAPQQPSAPQQPAEPQQPSTSQQPSTPQAPAGEAPVEQGTQGAAPSGAGA